MDFLLFVLVAAAIGYLLYWLISRDNARMVENIEADESDNEMTPGPNDAKF